MNTISQETIQRRQRYQERKNEINKARRENYKRDGEKIRERERTHYRENKEELTKEMREKYNNDPEYRHRKMETNRRYRMSEHGKATRNRIAKDNLKKYRSKLIELLGGKRCVRCGYNKDERALQIDHINGGGIKERRKGYTYLIHKKYVDNPILAKKTLQILCSNCNQLKKFDNKEM